MSILSDYTTENYLKAIAKHLSDPLNTRISTGDLARLLGVTSSTATTMMKRLERQGYVRYRSHHGCTLTAEGARYGLKILRRHRLLETFLVTHLDFDLESAHQEAERLEHAVSESFIEAINIRMGCPATDPNGNIIPDLGQEHFVTTDRPFSHAPIGRSLTVSRIKSDARVATYLKGESITVGTSLTIIEVDRTVGIAVVEADGERTRISAASLDYLYYSDEAAQPKEY